MITLQTILRSYSRTVETGHSDVDLTPRQRRVLVTLINLASNAGPANIVYPTTERTRDDVVKYLSDIVWDARPLVAAYASSSLDAPDFDVALERAITIIRGV